MDFHFKQFSINQQGVTHPVGTDGVLLGAIADVQDRAEVLDIGTGSGLLALMLAQRNEHAKIDAVELHEESARRARSNFKASPWGDRLSIFQGKIQDFRAKNGRYELIVSNPPFFSEQTFAPDETRRLGRHTATLSQHELLDAVLRLLSDSGVFYVILPVLEAQRLCERAVPMGLYWTRKVEIRSLPHKPVERWVLAFERTPYPFVQGQLLIYEKPGSYSPEYRALTSDFYL
jgi:tRNA1Val (adenine37-N6)-methyltransferase